MIVAVNRHHHHHLLLLLLLLGIVGGGCLATAGVPDITAFRHGLVVTLSEGWGVRPVMRPPGRVRYDVGMMKSVRAVLWGIFLALGVGALVVFGLVAPLFTFFFGSELTSTALPAVVVIFAAAFSFYWGGMIASYKAPSRRRLHGVLVGVASFAISPLVNLVAPDVTVRGGDPFANLRTPEALLFTGVLLVVVLAASYIGARRGERLFAYNQAVIRRQRTRKARERLSEGEE